MSNVLRRTKKKVVPKKTVTGQKRIVLVGTYGKGQFKRWPGYYNYPLYGKDKIDIEAAKRVNELWLFSGTKSPCYFMAECLGVKTREELKEFGYKPTSRVHGSGKYLLFKIKKLYAPSTDFADEVIIRTKDFAGQGVTQKRLKAYLESPDRKDPLLAKMLPKIVIEQPRERLRVCEAAVQLDFVDVLEQVEERMKKFANRKAGDKILRFIDLFAGIGGVRKGFELACEERGIPTQCVFTSEIKPHAIDVLKQNHPDEYIHGDITKVDEKLIPDFDVLLGGFPCQAFSAAGKRLGFEDTRGTLFFDVARILKEKKPLGFVLENVEGLVNHDKRNASDPYGHTLKVILATLDELGYKVSWRVLNASDFGVPQDRKRIYIVGARKAPCLDSFEVRHSSIASVLEHGLAPAKSKFIDKLLAHYSVQELQGKAIKDKRGGKNNIHSWDFELKGKVSRCQRELLNALLKERRKHQWAEQYGIDWMDGMPLTLDMIKTFFDVPNLKDMLEDLVAKRYVVKEHPKRKVKQGKIFVRVQDPALPLGYNIVAGKMSFEISKVMSPREIAPTLVAMDMQHLYVVDGVGLRTLTLREGLGMFGYPDDFKFSTTKELGYDLLGNTVVVPVIKAVASRLLKVIQK